MPGPDSRAQVRPGSLGPYHSGGSARICSKKDTFADGRVWEGIGIQPDILVRPTLADVKAGRDTVLDRAVEYLKGRTGI